MAGITQAQADEQLILWLAADAAVASGQSYTIGGRSFTRANSAEIRQNIEFWDRKARQLATGRVGPTLRGATPT